MSLNILLDYFMPIQTITPTAQASTAFLKQACVVVSPKDGGVTVGEIVECTSKAAVAALTNNTNADQLFDAGMNKVYVLPVDDLYLSDFLEGFESDFFTILISDDFDDADVEEAFASGNITITSYANLVSGTDDVVTVGGVAFTAQAGAATLGTATFQAATSNDATAASLAAQINAHATAGALVEAEAAGAVVTITAKNGGSVGNLIALGYTDNDTNVGATKSGTFLTGGAGLYLGDFVGVTGISSDDDAFLEEQAVIARRCAFHVDADNGAKNMFYAFGKLLSNPLNWNNQQYISMPVVDDVATLGQANSLFDEKISFVIDDAEFGARLALFACGGQAIVAPYIIKNLQLDMQSAALSYVSGNQPNYTQVHANLIEEELQQVVDLYVRRQWIEEGTANVALEQDNFVASADIDTSEPKALWRIQGQISQTL
jgi:hypothetical protein